MSVRISIHFFLILLLSAIWGQSLSIESCLIDTQDLKQLINKKNTTLVDVRNADDFSIIHIPESLNIKSHEIKYGYDIGTLSEICKTLRLSGFKSVQVLENGIAGWANENLAGSLNQEVNQSVFYVRPADIAGITDIKHVLVINITGKKSNRLDNYFVNVSRVSEKNNTSLFNQLKKINQSRKNQYHYMIVVDSDGRRYSALHGLNHIKNGMPVMFLSGGLDDLNSYDKKQSAISNKKEFTLQNLKGCGY